MCVYTVYVYVWTGERERENTEGRREGDMGDMALCLTSFFFFSLIDLLTFPFLTMNRNDRVIIILLQCDERSSVPASYDD